MSSPSSIVVPVNIPALTCGGNAACSTFIRQTLVEWTEQTIPQSFRAKAFYERHRAKGASHNATVRALASKWIRVLWRWWVDRPLQRVTLPLHPSTTWLTVALFAAQNSS